MKKNVIAAMGEGGTKCFKISIEEKFISIAAYCYLYFILVEIIYIVFLFFSEPLGTRTLLVYDLSALKPTEIVQKAVLQLDPGPNRQLNKTVNVSLFSLDKRAVSNTYLGSANLSDTTLDLARSLGPRSVNGLKRLIVRVDGPAKPSIGLVLYSMNTAGAPAKGHEMAKLLFEASNSRRRRSVVDNEVDVKKNVFADETKRKRKKKKGSRAGKLQVMNDNALYGV